MTENNGNDYMKNLTLLKKGETSYPDDTPDYRILESFDNRFSKRDYWISFECPEFTTRCPVTDQPDFGKIIIRYIPNTQCIESKSLKLYLFSYRNHNTFHEESVNQIMDDIVKACNPRKIIVEGIFNPRGGISINVKASHSLA